MVSNEQNVLRCLIRQMFAVVQNFTTQDQARSIMINQDFQTAQF